MIQKESILRIIDNSGVSRIKCIGFIDKPRKQNATLNKAFRASIQAARIVGRTKLDLTKGSKVKALVVGIPKCKVRLSGFFFRSAQSDAILLSSSDNRPLATKVRGLLPKELRKSGHSRLLSISIGIL